MNGTPRLRSAYPLTPLSNQKDSRTLNGTAPGATTPSVAGSTLPVQTDDPNAPLVPFEVLDAPSQRLSVSVVYVALLAWKFYDYHQLVSDQTDSLWLFMKWVAMDGVFLFGLPGLRVPWLEWSSTMIIVVFLAHAVLNAFLMFRLPVGVSTSLQLVNTNGKQLPVGTSILGFIKLYFYNRELAISERRVDPSTIRHNASLILGKQIVHILPEGYAFL